jgi:hypothetical protein
MTAPVKPQTVIRLYLAAFVALAMLTACSSVIAPNGRQRIYNVSYETVTNKLWALTPNPACIIPTNAAWTVHQTNPPPFPLVYLFGESNAVSAPLKPTPHPGFFPFDGQELMAGRTYQFWILEEPLETIANTGTSILVTRIDSKSTRVQIKSTHSGFFFNTRKGKIERKRMKELSELLSKKS